MALTPELTVGDAIKEIAVRLGFADQGTARTRAETRIQSFIRQAVAELAVEVEWADNSFEIEIPLIVGQDRYEYPEEANNGQLSALYLGFARGTRIPLDGGIRPQEFWGKPNDDTYRVPIGVPERWRIVDREIQIRPAPSEIDSAPNLIATVQRKMGPLTELTEVLPYDSELIMQRCVVLGRRHYQLPGLEDATRDYTKYLERVKNKQRAGTVFFVGGSKSHFVTRDKRVFVDTYKRETGQNAPWSDNWNPW